jgi:hypothetical protein
MGVGGNSRSSSTEGAPPPGGAGLDNLGAESSSPLLPYYFSPTIDVNPDEAEIEELVRDRWGAFRLSFFPRSLL